MIAKEIQNKMRITLIISSLAGGGAERAMVLIANHWNEVGQAITLITLADQTADAYDISPSVKRHALGLMRDAGNPWNAVYLNARRLWCLRQAIQASKPQVVISFMDKTNILTLIAMSGTTVPVIVMEQVDPKQYSIGRAWEQLRLWFYPRASAIVVPADPIRPWAKSIGRGQPVITIPNPVQPIPQCRRGFDVSLSPKRTVVAMGRLSPQKGFDLLIRAFALCAANHPEWSLVILGEGENRHQLEVLAENLDISHRIYLPGFLKQPETVLREANLFVMSSRYEGLPLALLEAMAWGLPVISTDCPTGPREIIRDNVDGILIPPEDVGALAMAMDRLMSDATERTRLANRAPEVVSRFGVEKVTEMWQDLLSHVLKSSMM